MQYTRTDMYTIIVGANHIMYLVKNMAKLTVYRRESDTRV